MTINGFYVNILILIFPEPNTSFLVYETGGYEALWELSERTLTNVADEDVRLIAEELKGLEIRMTTVETIKYHSEEGEGKVEELVPFLVREVKELAMSVASKTTDSVIETKVKDFGKSQELSQSESIH